MHLKNIFVPFSCLNCGSAQVKNTRFCHPCFELLFRTFHEKNPQEKSGIKILYLLNWIPNESDSLSKLHLELKNTHPQVWKWLAQKITKTLIQQNRELFKAGEPLVVTLKSQSGYNHSESWGEAISQELGLNHITALEKETISGVNHEQKKNNRADRRGLRLKSRVDLTSLSKRPIIFADDILTTGATLKEAYRVLGEPPQFIGLFVSHRKLH